MDTGYREAEEPLTVACVLWEGEFRGDRYNSEWVNKLHRMVDRNIDRPYRFVCLSNVPVDCERIELTDNLPGWWSKIELFRHDLGRVMFIDLDVLIDKGLWPILEIEGDFVATHKDVGEAPFSSPVMVWDSAKYHYIYEQFDRRYIYELRGDQDYIFSKVRSPSVIPQPWARKYHYKSKVDDADHTIVWFCVRKRNDELMDDEYVRRIWV